MAMVVRSGQKAGQNLCPTHDRTVKTESRGEGFDEMPLLLAALDVLNKKGWSFCSSKKTRLLDIFTNQPERAIVEPPELFFLRRPGQIH